MSEGTKSRTNLILAVGVLVVVLGVVIGILASAGSTKKHAVATTTVSTTTIPYQLKYNARQDVSESSCTHQHGEWIVAGGVVNSAKVSRKFQIIVDFTTTTGGTVQDSATLEIPRVKPNQELSWKLSGAKGATSANCVIRSVLAVPIH
jgi:hypothetical protein